MLEQCRISFFPQLNAYKNIQKYIREITKMISAVLESETDSYTKQVEQQDMM